MDILPFEILTPNVASQPEIPRRLGPPVEVIEAGIRVDQFLANKFRFLARHGWQQRLRAGRVFVNGNAVNCAYRVKTGDELSHLMPPGSEPETRSELELIYQSDRLLAVSKPPMLPMHEGGYYHQSTLVNFARQQFGRDWSPVHRLDLETSGLVLCTADSETREAVARQFRNRSIRKTYVFLTKYRPRDEEWKVQHSLGPIHVGEHSRQWLSPDGKTAETRFEWLETRGGLHLIRAFPLTGRTLQIRIHAATSGVPILGDRLCHPDESIYLRYKSRHDDPELYALTGHHRSCLHSESLEFVDPATNQMIRIHSPMYADMAERWNTAELSGLLAGNDQSAMLNSAPI
jgi:23S rRNA pseudouridine1911/1915/1917 synthase